MIKAYAYRFYNAVASIIDNTNKEGQVIDYGAKNTLPNDILRIIDDSGTATECLSKLSSFVLANGFSDEGFADIKNAKGQTNDEVLAELVPYVTTFDGGALLVRYAEDGKTPSLEVIPFEWVRKKRGGGFVVNEKFGLKTYKKNEDKSYAEFIPNLSTVERKKIIDADKESFGGQRGTILYFFAPRPGKTIYPVPHYYSAIEDVESDAGLVKMEKSNILEGFRADVILSTYGTIDNETKDGAGKTQADYFDDMIDEFTGPGGRKVMHLQASTPEGMPQVTVFNLAEILDGIDKARDRVPRAVCRHFGVPPVLIGLQMPEGLGNTQAIANSMKLFNHSVLKTQLMIQNAFEKVFTGMDATISTLNLIDFIPDGMMDAVTRAEKRQMLGLPEETGIPEQVVTTTQTPAP